MSAVPWEAWAQAGCGDRRHHAGAEDPRTQGQSDPAVCTPGPKALQNLTTMCSVKPASHVACGGSGLGPGGPGRDPGSGPAPCPGAEAAGGGWLARAGSARWPGRGPGHRGQERAPRPGGVSGRPGRHLKRRAGRGGGQSFGTGGARPEGPPARDPERDSNRDPAREPWRRPGRRGRRCCCSCCWPARRGPASTSARAGAATAPRARTAWPAWGAGARARGAKRVRPPFGDPAASSGCQEPRCPASLDL